MLDHVTLRAADLAASRAFYDTVLATLGIESPTHADDELVEWDDFGLSPATAEKPVTRRLHIGFGAESREHVDAFWETGTRAGSGDDGAPGPRPEYGPDYYGGFLLDPDGNSAEAVHHDLVPERGVIDHLWIRVADLEAAKAFYSTIAGDGGYELASEDPGERVQFQGAGSSFTFVPGTPTEELHIAFPAADHVAVQAFHRPATGAGYHDNGEPGEGPEYHPGFYGAFALDPDGKNVEAVFHYRR